MERIQGFIEKKIMLLGDVKIFQGTFDCHFCPFHKFMAVCAF